jgi:hypothetical protein
MCIKMSKNKNKHKYFISSLQKTTILINIQAAYQA